MAYFEALEAVKESPDADHNFTPTMLVVPSQLIVQTHREAIENFTGVDIQFFYGSAGDLALLGNTRTMTGKDLDMACRQWHKNRRNPEQVKTVILTTMETLSIRLVNKTTIRLPKLEASAWVHDACGLPKNVVVNVWERLGQVEDPFGDTTVDNLQDPYYYGSFYSRFPRQALPFPSPALFARDVANFHDTAGPIRNRPSQSTKRTPQDPTETTLNKRDTAIM